MGELIMGFLYFVVLGFFAFFYKVFGVNPFSKDSDKETYWSEYHSHRTKYRISEGLEGKR